MGSCQPFAAKLQSVTPSTPEDFEIAERDQTQILEGSLTPTLALPSIVEGVHDPLCGTIVGDRYELLSVIGMGGWSTVYRAHDKSLSRFVALKLMHAHLSVDQVKLQRFQREAERASALNHPNIATIHDCGTSNGRPYITMELIEGLSLAEMLAERKQLDAAECTNIFSQICDGIEAIHELGMIHRDLKPSNVKVSTTGSVKVLDFGLAKYVLQEQQDLTKTDESVGTPAYMSPEQCLGKSLDPRTDIYSLGCMMYECLTGIKPFIADNQLLCMQMHLQMVPARFASVRPDLKIPLLLEYIVHKALAKDPRDRFSSAAVLKGELAESLKPQGALSQVSNAVAWRYGAVRNQRPKFLLIMLIVIMILAATFIGVTHNPFVTTPMRTIRFPDRPVGKVYSVMRDVVDYRWTTETPIGVAQGTISVPASAIIKLADIPAAETKTLECLSTLGPRDLQALNLQNKPLTEDSMAAISKLTALQSLNIDFATGVSSEAFGKLNLPNLGGFSARGTQLVTDDGVKELAAHLVMVDYLSLALEPITDKSVDDLCLLRCLTTLNLNRTKITDVTLKRIVQLPRISSLLFAYDDITDAGLAQLTKISGLTSLDLRGYKVTDRSVDDCFVKMTSLRNLDLRDSAISEGDVARLKKALPKCEVLFGKYVLPNQPANTAVSH